MQDIITMRFFTQNAKVPRDWLCFHCVIQRMYYTIMHFTIQLSRTQNAKPHNAKCNNEAPKHPLECSFTLLKHLWLENRPNLTVANVSLHNYVSYIHSFKKVSITIIYFCHMIYISDVSGKVIVLTTEWSSKSLNDSNPRPHWKPRGTTRWAKNYIYH